MKFLKKYLLFILILFNHSVFAQKSTQKEKVIFIIVDGVAEDMLEKSKIPNLDRIKREGAMLKAYVGGTKGSYSETPTISAVGYNSLLTGTWVNKHHVYDNNIKTPNYNYPTIFRLLKNQFPNKKTAIFSTWEDNRTKLIGENLPETGHVKVDYAFDGMEKDTIRFPHDKESHYIRKIDSLVANTAAHYIKENAPDLSWVYLQFTDDMGHQYGDSNILYEAISFEDRLIGKIYDAVKEREKYHDENWLFIVTTDHGRSPINGKGHGGQSDRERNTWIVINKSIINKYAKNNRVAITDIFPTMIDFLNIKVPVPIQQEIDGIDLLKPRSAYDLKASLSSDNILKVDWKTVPKTKGNAEILIATTNNFATGGTDSYQLLGEVDLNEEQFESKLKTKSSDIYKIVLKTKDGFLNTWIYNKHIKQ